MDQKQLRDIQDMTREELLGFLEDAALLWLAHDGLWFQAVERRYGTDVGRQCSGEAIAGYSGIEAKRILKRFGLPANGGIPALMQALKFRIYHLINKQDFVEVSEKRCIFRMRECRVQAMRKKKGASGLPLQERRDRGILALCEGRGPQDQNALRGMPARCTFRGVLVCLGVHSRRVGNRGNGAGGGRAGTLGT